MLYCVVMFSVSVIRVLVLWFNVLLVRVVWLRLLKVFIVFGVLVCRLVRLVLMYWVS